MVRRWDRIVTRGGGRTLVGNLPIRLPLKTPWPSSPPTNAATVSSDVFSGTAKSRHSPCCRACFAGRQPHPNWRCGGHRLARPPPAACLAGDERTRHSARLLGRQRRLRGTWHKAVKNSGGFGSAFPCWAKSVRALSRIAPAVHGIHNGAAALRIGHAPSARDAHRPRVSPLAKSRSAHALAQPPRSVPIKLPAHADPLTKAISPNPDHAGPLAAPTRGAHADTARGSRRSLAGDAR